MFDRPKEMVLMGLDGSAPDSAPAGKSSVMSNREMGELSELLAGDTNLQDMCAALIQKKSQLSTDEPGLDVDAVEILEQLHAATRRRLLRHQARLAARHHVELTLRTTLSASASNALSVEKGSVVEKTSSAYQASVGAVWPSYLKHTAAASDEGQDVWLGKLFLVQPAAAVADGNQRVSLCARVSFVRDHAADTFDMNVSVVQVRVSPPSLAGFFLSYMAHPRCLYPSPFWSSLTLIFVLPL